MGDPEKSMPGGKSDKSPKNWITKREAAARGKERGGVYISHLVHAIKKGSGKGRPDSF